MKKNTIKIQGIGNSAQRFRGHLKPRQNDFGFTLLELMISIVMIGIMVLILMSVLRLGFRSVEAGEKRMESTERVRTAFNLIEAQIQSEIPLTFDDNGEQKFYFKGERTAVTFSTNYSIWDGERGYVVASYQVVNEGPGKQTLLAAENKVGVENRNEIKLLERFEELFFEYYYQGPTEEKGKWIDQWTESTLIPGKIKLHLTERGKALAWIIPIKTGESLKTLQTTPLRRQ